MHSRGEVQVLKGVSLSQNKREEKRLGAAEGEKGACSFLSSNLNTTKKEPVNEGVNKQTKAYNFKEKPPFQLHAQELELAGCDGGVCSLTVYIASRQPTPHTLTPSGSNP